MKQIFEETKLGDLTLKNRLIRSATWEGIASPDGGLPEEAYAIYNELAAGGVGAVITGFTSVALHDHYFGGMMRLCDDALIPQYRTDGELNVRVHVAKRAFVMAAAERDLQEK